MFLSEVEGICCGIVAQKLTTRDGTGAASPRDYGVVVNERCGGVDGMLDVAESQNAREKINTSPETAVKMPKIELVAVPRQQHGLFFPTI